MEEHSKEQVHGDDQSVILSREESVGRLRVTVVEEQVQVSD